MHGRPHCNQYIVLRWLRQPDSNDLEYGVAYSRTTQSRSPLLVLNLIIDLKSVFKHPCRKCCKLLPISTLQYTSVGRFPSSPPDALLHQQAKAFAMVAHKEKVWI